MFQIRQSVQNAISTPAVNENRANNRFTRRRRQDVNRSGSGKKRKREEMGSDPNEQGLGNSDEHNGPVEQTNERARSRARNAKKARHHRQQHRLYRSPSAKRYVLTLFLCIFCFFYVFYVFYVYI